MGSGLWYDRASLGRRVGIMESCDIIIKSSALRHYKLNLPRFFVYAWKRKNEYLYIGKTKVGLSRIRNHNIISKIEPRQEEDLFEIWICSVDLELDDLERNLIFKLQPKYNKQNNPDWVNDYDINIDIELPSLELAACRNSKEVRELIEKIKKEKELL